ncbi:MAG: hypothetical protein IT375_06720 [Polyangiaceae bacterium]|nr:hypothetical protein [Polyangiaceae bacterium]
MQELDHLPVVGIPTDLSDEAAAQLLEFLHELSAAIERHYYAQLRRHYGAADSAERDLKPATPSTDPPF